MKYIGKLCAVVVLALIMAGCGDNAGGKSGVNNGNSVDKVISEQMEKSDLESSDTAENNQSAEETGNSEDESSDINEQDEKTDKTTEFDTDAVETETADMNSADGQEGVNNQASGEVDYDLTVMSKDMVYATVYQMLADPETYVGKTFRINGLYYGAYYEPTAKYYHYCVIQDATACCAEGFEFVWDDGSHVYPDEYPQENAMITVQGVFEIYQDEGDNKLYCRLKDASLEVMDNQ